ncbi:DUF1127 domain-containing protein [Oricola nitratireducens]|uniref:DUF1127 domain-containing protein n=1 Tax=Oricola nitratireducens TaxID=2775868 RepID=UPI00186914FA|nr:DUF1127 domain-containing protein [Oricola nitratireducens]
MSDSAVRSAMSRRRGVLPRRAQITARIVHWLRLWRRKRRSRRHLSDLADWQLRDIGVSPRQAKREVRKSFPWHKSFPWLDERKMPHDPWC